MSYVLPKLKLGQNETKPDRGSAASWYSSLPLFSLSSANEFDSINSGARSLILPKLQLGGSGAVKFKGTVSTVYQNAFEKAATG